MDNRHNNERCPTCSGYKECIETVCEDCYLAYCDEADESGVEIDFEEWVEYNRGKLN